MSIVIRRNIGDLVVFGHSPILNALRQIEASKLGTTVVINEDGTLIGTISDGDFRRWLMVHQSPSFDSSCDKITNRKCVSAKTTADLKKIQALMCDGVELIPLLDDRGRVDSIAIQKQRQIEIQGRLIERAQPAFIIAEIGINHNGKFDTAKDLVDAASFAGADCVKFQMRDFESLYRGNFGDAIGSEDLGAEYTQKLVLESALSTTQILELMDYASTKDLIPICTAWDSVSVEVLIKFGVSAFKIASADLTNHSLIAEVLEANVPVIMSTGMATESEIISSVEVLKESMASFALLHCQSTYPPAFKDINLKYMSRLEEIGDSVVGYSSHERGFHVAVSSVALGALIIEKHITLDRSARGVDHVVSLEPTDFKTMVRHIRSLEEAIGTDLPRSLTQGEKLNRLSLAKSLVARKDLNAGHVLAANDIAVKGPGKGIQPNRLDELIGVKLVRDIQEGDFFFETDFLGQIEARRNFVFDRPWGLPVRFHDWRQLSQGTNPDFLEFHLSNRDMSIPVDEIIPEKLKMSLVVHSPDLFDGDHILDLASMEEDVWRQSIVKLQQVIDLTHQLSQKFVSNSKPKVIVSMGGSSLDYPLEFSERGRLYERVNNALSKIDRGEILLLAQTLPPFPWYLGGQRFCNLFVDPEETAEFSETYGIDLCLDVSHTKLACNFLAKSFSDAIELLAPLSKHLHLVDAAGTDDEGLQIDDGEIDWIHLLRQISRLAPGVSFIPEIWQGHSDNGAGFWKALSQLESYCEQLKLRQP
jgi:sialic acid synthase SpsE/sugar phosphate isomerase/epimerase